jgi:tape measure domain-containing protein
MANEATILRIRAQVENLEGLNRVRSAVRNFANESKIASNDLDKLYSSLKQLNTESVRSVNNLQNYRNGLDSLRKSAEIGGTTFNKLTSEIKQLDIQLGKLQTRQASGVGAVNKIGQSIGAVAAAGVFGGLEGLIGAGIGAIGGPGGALAGGAIGAQVGMIRQSIASMAEYAAQIGRLQIALQGVTKTSDEYASAQEAISRISKDLNVPILEATKGFTRLSASVIGAGGKVSDAAVVFRAFTQAIKATGGGAEEVNGVMTALTQIFSKGKISAEEINQIAERLPGAFTAIASATGRTGFELQEALKKGEVGLNDLMKTADSLTTQYSASADRMAKSTDDAGARMKVALDELGKTFGNFFKPIGAGFQDFITQIVTATNKMIEMAQLRAALGKTVSFGEQVENNKTAMRIAELRYPNNPEKQRSETYKINQELQANSLKRMGIEAGIVKIPSALAATERTVFTSPKVDDTVGGGTKTAENAAKRLEDRKKEQLADADKLLATENGRFEIATAANELEKIQAEYDKTQVERRVKFLALQKGALSEKAREVYAEAQYAAIQADRFEYNAKIQKLMEDQTKELYAQVGMSATLNKNLQAALFGAFDGGTATGTFRTDVDLMPGLTGGELGSKIEELKKSLADLQDPIKQVMAGAQAIGEAFSTSFKGLIDGSMSAQEALAGFFKSIANHFLDMASQMIAKYIEMQIIGLAKQLLPGMFGGIFGPGGAPDYSGSSVSVPNQYSYSANGNVFAQNGIVPYAKGGIVDRPMMFPFAKGIGLMGEAGPEAIMPLKRGADGKLGVAGGGGGGGVSVGAINISVQNTGDSLSPAAQKQIAGQVQGIVMATLVDQRRSGGVLR